MRRIVASTILLNVFLFHGLVGQVPADIQRYRSEPLGLTSNTVEATLSGNRISTLFSNDGQIGKWGFQPSLVWPLSSTVSYLAGHTVLVGAEFLAPGNGQTIHAVETSYREQWDHDPWSGQQWGFTPVPGYHRTGRITPTIASRTDPTTWPTTWPAALGLGPSGDGAWYFHNNAARGLGTREAMFIMDDSRDKEWTRSPYNFYPVLSDSTRGGLGLRVEARLFQWSDSIARDMFFMHYDIWNVSDVDYPVATVGILSEPSIGYNDTKDDGAVFDSAHGIVYLYDSDGMVPVGSTPTGYFGYVFLALPGPDTSASSAHPRGVAFIDADSSEWHPSNDEALWRAMTSGRIDSAWSTGGVALVMSGGTFPLHKWSKVSMALAFVFADSLAQLFELADLARTIASNGYLLPESTSTFVDHDELGAARPDRWTVQAFPNPFNPTTTVRYALPHAAQVRVALYNTLGQRVATIVDGFQAAGVHDARVDGSGLASGVYVCRLQVDGATRSTKLVLNR